MYACICEGGGRFFSRGCALPIIARRFLATHPPRYIKDQSPT
jgi:hypothetical protein